MLCVCYVTFGNYSDQSRNLLRKRTAFTVMHLPKEESRGKPSVSHSEHPDISLLPDIPAP